MSEPRSHYIACASGHNVFTDCLVTRHGDLIRLTGHSIMDFTTEGALDLIHAIADRLPPGAAKPPDPTKAESSDAIVEEARAMLLARSQLGLKKYGTTLMRNDVHLIDWMRYAVEESLDRTLYMIRAIKDLERLYDDGC